MFRANPLPIEPSDLERDLLHVTGVESAIVTVDEHHRIELIELIADRRANELLRQEVNEVLGARWGVEVAADRLLMVDSGERRARPRPHRPAAVTGTIGAPTTVPEPHSDSSDPELVTVSLAMHERSADVTVVLSHAGAKATGVASGAPSRSNQRRLVVAAVLDAWTKLVGPHRLELSEVTVVHLGSDDVVVTLLTHWSHGNEAGIARAALVGAAGELRAVADATIGGLGTYPSPRYDLGPARQRQFG